MAAMVAMAADRAAPVTVAAAASEVAAMPPGCHHLAPELPNLCAAHCQQGQQSADTASAALVGLALPAPLYPLALPVPPVPGSGRSFPAHDASLDAVPEPPHAVLHCVLRT